MGPLGIVDWGIGGLGLLKELDAVAPGRDVVYWSDTGSVPYGMQSTSDLAARLRVVVDELAELGCTQAMLACNAASTVVNRLSVPIPVEGIIAAGVAAVPDDMTGVIGVVGGRRTINAGIYRRALARPDRTVVSRVAQPLSAHIEAGRTGSPEFMADLRKIVAPMRGATSVVLACTHYPAAAEWFAGELPGTHLIDPAAQMARDLSSAWGEMGGKPGTRTVITTGNPKQMRSATQAAWGMVLGRIECRTT